MSRRKACRSGAGTASVPRLASGRRKLERAGPAALSSASDGVAGAPALAGELASLATWLGLGAIRVAPSGTLAPALSSALG